MRKMVGRLFHDFGESEDGAVTVDWVVLTAAIVITMIFIIKPLWAQLDLVTGATANKVEAYGDAISSATLN